MNFFISYNLGKNKISGESNGDFKAKEKMDMEAGDSMNGEERMLSLMKLFVVPLACSS